MEELNNFNNGNRSTKSDARAAERSTKLAGAICLGMALAIVSTFAAFYWDLLTQAEAYDSL